MNRLEVWYCLLTASVLFWAACLKDNPLWWVYLVLGLWFLYDGLEELLK